MGFKRIAIRGQEDRVLGLPLWHELEHKMLSCSLNFCEACISRLQEIRQVIKRSMLDIRFDCYRILVVIALVFHAQAPLATERLCFVGLAQFVVQSINRRLKGKTGTSWRSVPLRVFR